jgi:hypothetical protein
MHQFEIPVNNFAVSLSLSKTALLNITPVSTSST